MPDVNALSRLVTSAANAADRGVRRGVLDGLAGALDAIAAETGRWLPFTHRATALEVLVESSAGRWRGRWRLSLGIRP